MSLEMATRSLRKFPPARPFSIRVERRILVRPSTSLPISGPKELIDLRPGEGLVLDDVVQQRRDDGCVVELQIGEDGGNFERVGEIGFARGALLVPWPSWHRLGAVEQRLVSLGS